MRLETAIGRIKTAGHDISDEYTKERCIEFLNTALQQTSSLLISAQYPALVKEVLVRNGDRLPQNYMKAAGTYPIRMTAGRAEIVDGSNSVRFRYWATPDLLDELTEELPYPHDAINDVVVRAAIILALNENEYDVTQDSNLLTALQNAIASAM